MRLAFVGIKRSYKELEEKNYVNIFNKFHLEIPWYYAMYGGNDVVVTTIDGSEREINFESGGKFTNINEKDFRSRDYDVVIHWRKWFEEFYIQSALNIVHTCDHSYESSWVSSIQTAFNSGKLYGLDCYPTWHLENLHEELYRVVPYDRLLDGFTFGVDTDIYFPKEKDKFQMLWSSDPGRGLQGAIRLALELYQIDKRFNLHVCYPDYVRGINIPRHPAIIDRGNVPNGEPLWELFRTSGILPYTSTFKEPSSRAFRQAQSSGMLVFYPPDTGSPSRFIKDGIDGYVRPINEWKSLILDVVNDDHTYNKITSNARLTAISESWHVQALRFNERIGDILRAYQR